VNALQGGTRSLHPDVDLFAASVAGRGELGQMIELLMELDGLRPLANVGRRRFGGGFGSRLRLVGLCEPAITTPQPVEQSAGRGVS
jgi:hypothetical protein